MRELYFELYYTCGKVHKDKLQVLQNRAARVITGARFDVNSANVLEDCNGPRSVSFSFMYRAYEDVCCKHSREATIYWLLVASVLLSMPGALHALRSVRWVRDTLGVTLRPLGLDIGTTSVSLHNKIKWGINYISTVMGSVYMRIFFQGFSRF